MIVPTVVILEMASNDQSLEVFQRKFKYGSDKKRKIKSVSKVLDQELEKWSCYLP